MAVTIQPLFEPQQIASTITTYFTAGVATRIDALTVTNVNSGARVVSFYWVPSGGAANSTNQIVASRPLQPNESWDVSPFIGQVLNPGDSLAAICDSAAAVNLFGSGTAVSG